MYDTKPGGIGLCYAAFQLVQSVVESAHDLVADCSCPRGCPKCIFDFQCEHYNVRLDKVGGLMILVVRRG